MQKIHNCYYTHKGCQIFKAGPLPRYSKRYVIYIQNGSFGSRFVVKTLERAVRLINRLEGCTTLLKPEEKRIEIEKS